MYVYIFIAKYYTCDWSTFNKCTATHSFWTGAHRNMVDDVAFSIYTTSIFTRIYTLVESTSFVLGTV